MKKCFLTVILIFWSTIMVSNVLAKDLLDQAYDEVWQEEFASDQDGEDVLGNKSLNIGLGSGGFSVGLRGPITSRVAQFLLRMVVILAIPMILYTSIKMMMSSGDEGKFKESLKQLGYVVLGVFLALMSIVLVLLIISLTNTNLGNI